MELLGLVENETLYLTLYDLGFASVKFQSKPSTIYASTKTEEALLSALQRNGMATTTSSN